MAVMHYREAHLTQPMLRLLDDRTMKLWLIRKGFDTLRPMKQFADGQGGLVFRQGYLQSEDCGH